VVGAAARRGQTSAFLKLIAMNISVFGGSSPKPGQPAYQEALQLGKLIGLGSHTAITGGYMGVMEAVSRGAAENGGHVIGVTCTQIESWRGGEKNKWVAKEIKRDTLLQRLDTIIQECDTAIALPGGVGTLTEILLMWNLMIVQELTARPLVLVGVGWQNIYSQLLAQQVEYIPEDHKGYIYLAGNIESAYQIATQPH